MSIYVTFPGNANDTWNFGGSTYDLWNAFRQLGQDASGLDLSHSSFHAVKRYGWNLKEVLLGRGMGGYQYSNLYLNDIWRKELKRLEQGVILNLFQLFHPSVFSRPGLKTVFYIDQTMAQLFSHYIESKDVSGFHRKQALEKEGLQYQQADLILCMCQWAADSVSRDYGIPASKIGVAAPGGSIDPRTLSFMREKIAARDEPDLAAFTPTRPLRFVYVGVNPWRKGLFRFLDALKCMPDALDRIELTVIGPDMECPMEYRDIPGLDWKGRIKRELFVDMVSSHDVGILLSTAEATGRSLREFQMLGLGVLYPNVGGSPEMVTPGAGLRVEVGDGPAEIAAHIRFLLDRPEIVKQMRTAAWNARHEMTWLGTAETILSHMRAHGLLGV